LCIELREERFPLSRPNWSRPLPRPLKIPSLGSHLLVLNDGEVIELLRAAVEREGNQTAFARRYGIERTRLNQILKGKKGVTRGILKALGLRKVYAPE
jgi:DNA-binding phage protein